MNIVLFGRSISEDFFPYMQKLIQELEDNGINFCINASFYDVVKRDVYFKNEVNLYHKPTDVEGQIDYLFSIGGDGTILSTITAIRDRGIPVVGINSGRLGFLANISKEHISEIIQALIHKEYRIEERSMIQLRYNENSVFGQDNFALNEFTIHKKDSASMITIHTYVNGMYLNSYWADGLIVATPTGSTAYSMSCGGPILDPSSHNFVITPIAPHNLSIRPIIIDDSSEIKLVVEGREETFLATLDSRSKEVDSGQEIYLSKCEFTIKLVQFNDQNFFSTIRKKLLWGLDKRN